MLVKLVGILYAIGIIAFFFGVIAIAFDQHPTNKNACGNLCGASYDSGNFRPRTQ